MSKTSSETRTLLLILGVVGLLSCGCLCVPLGLLGVGIGLPAIAQVQKAADKVARQQQQMPDWVQRPIPGVPPVAPAPPNFGPVEFTPPPPAFIPPAPRETPATPPNPGGLAALSEAQRQNVYFSATIHSAGWKWLKVTGIVSAKTARIRTHPTSTSNACARAWKTSSNERASAWKSSSIAFASRTGSAGRSWTRSSPKAISKAGPAPVGRDGRSQKITRSSTPWSGEIPCG